MQFRGAQELMHSIIACYTLTLRMQRLTLLLHVICNETKNMVVMVVVVLVAVAVRVPLTFVE